MTTKAARAVRYYTKALERDVSATERHRLETCLTVAQLALSGCCRLCGTVLEDPDSVARGVGPVCATKVDA